jgi:hypothetical protein
MVFFRNDAAQLEAGPMAALRVDGKGSKFILPKPVCGFTFYASEPARMKAHG